MNTQDFERLKAVCEKDAIDFCDFLEKTIKNAMANFLQEKLDLLEKKDPWDGVEFAELVNYIPTTSTIQNQFTSGKIYRISRIYGSDYKRLEVKEDDSGRLNGLDLLKFKPSTESAYIEQLKKEAHERFGEIREGQIFIDAHLNVELKITWATVGFVYSKDLDALCIGGVIIYKSGKWAARVKERIEVNYGWTYGEIMGTETPICLFGNKDLSKSVFRGMNDNEIGKAFKFIASQLEEYLNKE